MILEACYHELNLLPWALFPAFSPYAKCAKLGPSMRNLAKLLGQMFLGLRFRLLLLVVITCTPLIALTLHKAGEDRRRAMSFWHQRATRMMQSASREEE